MPVVTIQRARARVALVSERIQIDIPDETGELQRSLVPLAEIERLVMWVHPGSLVLGRECAIVAGTYESKFALSCVRGSGRL